MNRRDFLRGSAGILAAAAVSRPSLAWGAYYLPEFNTYGQRLTFGNDTRLGLNLNSNISRNWTVAAQLEAESVNASYSMDLDWGFISYRPMPELAIRGGRLVAPFWLYSQQIKVGYNYLWVRPPVEVYSLINGFSSVNGVSLLSVVSIGGGELSSELYGGADDVKSYSNNPSAPASADIRITDLIGIDLTYTFKELFTLHASYAQSHDNVKVEARTPIPNFGVINGTAVAPLDIQGGKFFSFGGKAEYANVLLVSEFARRLLSGQALQTASAWYATLGYRISKFTPYFTYGWLGKLSGSYYLHPDYPTVTTLKTGQYSYTYGLNAQVTDAVILKAEWQPAYYQFADSSKNFRVNVASMSANFIF